MSPPSFKNRFLSSLPPDIVTRLRLRPVLFPLLYAMEFPGKTISHLYFVEQGMASMTTTFENGTQVEVGTFGIEAAIGISGLMGTKRSLNRVYTQIAGTGYRCPLEAGRKEFQRGETFQAMTLGCVQMQLTQTAQTAACNARHNLEQRLARWLLICVNRTNQLAFPISQDFLADMIGSTRPTVSVMANILKQAGLIEYRRGVITVKHIEGLEARSCECYKIVRDHLGDDREFSSGRGA